MTFMPRIIAVGEELPPTDGEQLQPTDRPASRDKDKAKGKARSAVASRFHALNDFVDATMGELSRSEIAVWFILFRDARKGIAQTGQTDMARRAGCNRRTVGRALRRLIRRGLLKIIRPGGLNRGPARYRVIPTGCD